MAQSKWGSDKTWFHRTKHTIFNLPAEIPNKYLWFSCGMLKYWRKLEFGYVWENNYEFYSLNIIHSVLKAKLNVAKSVPLSKKQRN